jgi:hypothetical protein
MIPNAKEELLSCTFITTNPKHRKPCVLYLHSEFGNSKEGMIFSD